MEEMSFSTDLAVRVALLDAGFGDNSPEVLFHLNLFKML